MNESFRESLINGYRIWRSNLVLGVPNVVSFFVTLFVFFAAFFVVAMFLGLSSSNLGGSGSFGFASFVVPVLVVFAALVVCFIVNSFLVAGSTGMTLNVVRSGRTNLGDMFYFGGRFFAPVFVALFCCFFVFVFVGFVLFLPAITAVYLKWYNVAVSLFILAAITFTITTTTLIIVFSLTPLTITTENLGAIESLKKSLIWASKNKLKLFLFWTTYLSICGLANTIFNILIGPLRYIQIISPALYMLIVFLLFGVFIVILLSTTAPLAYVWLARIYLGGGKTETKTLREPLSRYAQKKTSAQPSMKQELYI